MSQVAIVELKRWLEDCRLNALLKGWKEEEILIAFLDKSRELLVEHLIKDVKGKM